MGGTPSPAKQREGLAYLPNRHVRQTLDCSRAGSLRATQTIDHRPPRLYRGPRARSASARMSAFSKILPRSPASVAASIAMPMSSAFT